jgi:hypothetical protein
VTKHAEEGATLTSEYEYDEAGNILLNHTYSPSTTYSNDHMKYNAANEICAIATSAPSAFAALRQHRETQLLERAVAGPAYGDLDLVFANELGAPIHPQRLRSCLASSRSAAGIPPGSLHVLRHAAATLALDAGVSLHVRRCPSRRRPQDAAQHLRAPAGVGRRGGCERPCIGVG